MTYFKLPALRPVNLASPRELSTPVQLSNPDPATNQPRPREILTFIEPKALTLHWLGEHQTNLSQEQTHMKPV
jgi:hypothetical protein